MSDGLKITPATLKRLPIYLRILKEKSKEEYISSTTIAENLRISSIQVRKDLASISKVSGTSKKGFKISELIAQIEEFMGIEKSHIAVLVGAGKLGQALMGYTGFAAYGLNILAAFDAKTFADRTEEGKPVYNIDHLVSYCKENNVLMGIIAVPADHAQDVCDQLVACGIKAIWNFAPTHLEVPSNILVQNENMATSLAVLSMHLQAQIKDKK